MLNVTGVNAGYGNALVLREMSLEIQEGELVALVGANGAGKSTLLMTISGIIKPKSGSITLDKNELHKMRANEIVNQGVIHVPEGRKLFPQFTVYENLLIASINPRAMPKRKQNLEVVFALFPRLWERKAQKAATLSGGEQQMLAVARGLMAEPRILLLDEPSWGLAPKLITTIFEALVETNRQGMSMLLVEQNVNLALDVAKRGYVLENGRVVMSGTSQQLRDNDQVRKAYLGM
jgi:branched-chain amino acid transport system ATP-binding protein